MREWLSRLDPNDDPDAEPLGPWPLVALAAALFVSVGLFLRFRIQPMQDLGHHLAMAAVVADRSRAGSIYPALYEPIDLLAANSLLYVVAGYLGRLIGVTAAVRVCVVFYLVGMPLAVLWSLRVFGRSAWGAVLAVPLGYNMSFVAGFANVLFAAPFAVLAVPVFYRMLLEPTLRRQAGTIALFVVVFLSHAHVFLWFGVLAFVLTLARMVAAAERPEPLLRKLREAASIGFRGFVAVAPALLLLAHWYVRAFGSARATQGVRVATASAEQDFGAWYQGYGDLFHNLAAYSFKTLVSDEDLALLALLAVLVGGAVVLARLHRWGRPPVLEACCVLTFLSYFFLPEGLSGHEVLGSRQPGMALWFLPAFLSPVPARVSRAARGLVIGGILILTWAWLDVWRNNLLRFERFEAAGLEEVLAAAPPRKRMHYVKMVPESDYFTWKALWHVDKYYMADKFGYVPDTPAILSTSAIRLRSGVALHRVLKHDDAWPQLTEIWDNYDLILVHDWEPEPEDLAEAERRGRLLRASGLWQLWETKPPP